MESNRGVSTNVRGEQLEGLDGARPYLVARLPPLLPPGTPVLPGPRPFLKSYDAVRSPLYMLT